MGQTVEIPCRPGRRIVAKGLPKVFAYRTGPWAGARGNSPFGINKLIRAETLGRKGAMGHTGAMVDTASAPPPGPLALHRETVRPEWIDYNGHMNVAYYVLAFDHATETLFERLGIGEDYVRAKKCSLFVVDMHVTYEQELVAGDRVRFETQILGHDRRRLHLFHRMIRDADGVLAATTEVLTVHVDMDLRRAAPFPDDVRARIATLADAHACLPQPSQAGRTIALGRGQT